jgi:hypothetical protein
MGDLQGRMREIAAEQNELIAQLGQGYDEFVRARMQELLGVQEQVQQAITRQAQTAANAVRQQGQTMGGAFNKENKAAEKGSVEAFSIIAGDKQDRQFNALNDILREAREARALNRQQLQELRNRYTVAVARL